VDAHKKKSDPPSSNPIMQSSKPTQKVLSSLNITFLGTASAQPSSTRNHSALALRLGADVWLFDCGEATQHQVQKSGVKMGKINKIFITHTHGEYSLGAHENAQPVLYPQAIISLAYCP